MRKIAALIQLIRPLNFLITFFVIAIAYYITADNNYSWHILLIASLSGAFTAAAGNIVNDIFDTQSDKINHPKRPLASNTLSYNSAKSVWFLFTLSSFILSSIISIYAFLIVLGTHIILILYSYRLKSLPVAGNTTIALLTAAAFLYGGYAGGNIEKVIIPAVFAFLINYIRELIKDIQDLKGDAKTGTLTFPIKYGTENTKKFILVFITVLLIFTTYPFITEIYKIEFIILMMLIVNPLLVYVIKILNTSKDDNVPKRISGILKFNMIVGLLAIYLGQ
jgi:geranylgeranylglycerol-phosphate geranylgeranyltransferase